MSFVRTIPPRVFTQSAALGAESTDDPGILERTTGLPSWVLTAGGFALLGLWLLPKVEGGFHAARRIAQGQDRRGAS